MRHVLNNNFRQMLASKGMLFVMLLLPVLVFAVSLGLMGGGEGMYRWNVAWVDHDNSALSAGMAETIKPDASRLEAMTAEQADDEILNSKADLAVVVPQGFAQQVMAGNAPSITVRSLKGQEVTGVVSASLNLYVDNLLRLRDITNLQDEAELAAEQARLAQEGLQYHEQRLNTHTPSAALGMSSGFLIYVLSISMLQLGSMILREKQQGTLYRIRQAPVKRLGYIIAVFLTGVMVLVINLLSLFVLTHTLMPVRTTLSMYVLWFYYGLLWIFIGIFLALTVRSSAVHSSLMPIISVITAMLGGCYWPIWMMPEFMQKAAMLVPQYWANEAISLLQQGKTLLDLPQHLLALTGFSALFLALCVFALRRSKAAGTFV
ncbi:MAG: ABC transporter permease [Christensenellales bacterium]